MASYNSVLLVGFLFCFTCYVGAEEVEDLQPLVKSTEDTLQGAKTHVDHMLNLSPIPNEDKLPPIVKNESEHLAFEIKKLTTKLQEKIAVGEHKAEISQAVNSAITHLNEAAATLEHVGTDLKQDNIKYYAAADKLLHETKNILAAGPCQELAPLLKAALNELTHDVNNYQYGIHDSIGPHEADLPPGSKHEGPGHEHHKTEGAGHDHHHHHVHKHHGASSEESGEDKSSGEHHHH